VVLSDRPTFHWSPLAGATGYRVEVYDEKFNLAAASPEVAVTSWTAPAPLERGAIHSWQVKALKEGRDVLAPRPPAGQALFRVLDADGAGRLARVRREHGSSHLLLGILYGRAGLLDDAERELRAVQRENPDSEVVRRLLASAQALRR
jgi:hypothetical protein